MHCIMKFDYRKLWKILIDKSMTKKNLMEVTSITAATMAKMGKGLPVSMIVLGKICKALEVTIGDIVDYVGDSN